MDDFTLSNYLKNKEADPKKLSEYRTRYKTVKSKITSKWYIDKSTGCIVIAMKIPSEKANNYFYDVIFELKGTSANDTSRKLKMAPIRVYSNCPSFVYTNANLFKKKGWMIEWATSLYDPKALADPEKPKDKEKKQTNDSVVYEKSLFFAASYLHDLNPIAILTNVNAATVAVNTNQILLFVKGSQKALEHRQTKVKVDKGVKKAENLVKKTVGMSNTPKVKSITKTIKSTKSSKIKHI